MVSLECCEWQNAPLSAAFLAETQNWSSSLETCNRNGYFEG